MGGNRKVIASCQKIEGSVEEVIQKYEAEYTERFGVERRKIDTRPTPICSTR